MFKKKKLLIIIHIEAFADVVWKVFGNKFRHFGVCKYQPSVSELLLRIYSIVE